MAGAIIDVTSDEWGTPVEFFKLMENLFGKFDLDAAADDNWNLCEKYLTKKQDALNPNTTWDGINIWLNPPYGKWIPKFLLRVLEEALKDKTIICLLPSKTDTIWFHKIVAIFASELIFIEGRLNFRRKDDGKSQGFVSSIIVKFDKNSVEQRNGPKVSFLSIRKPRKRKK